MRRSRTILSCKWSLLFWMRMTLSATCSPPSSNIGKSHIHTLTHSPRNKLPFSPIPVYKIALNIPSWDTPSQIPILIMSITCRQIARSTTRKPSPKGVTWMTEGAVWRDIPSTVTRWFARKEKIITPQWANKINTTHPVPMKKLHIPNLKKMPSIASPTNTRSTS